MRPTARPVLAALAAVAPLLAGTLVALSPAAPATAVDRAAARASSVISRPVRIAVENTDSTPAVCYADDRSYMLRGRLVGPRREVLGSNISRANVLVHDLATGSWFWNLRHHPAYDYAGRLAARGETSLVLDRLGYGASHLADGHATCLGAQADMLHQVVQHLRSGQYHFVGSRRTVPTAQHVVLHGHSVGAAIAELEAGTYDDVAGLVLMSWSDQGASRRAVDEASRQSGACLGGQDYVRTGTSPKDYRSLLVVTAPRSVQRAALSHRDGAPCGDPLSLSSVVTASTLTTRKIEAPVLLLFGGRDALVRDGSSRQQRQAFDSAPSVASHVVPGAGSALPLERSAPRTRARVLHWLAGLPG